MKIAENIITVLCDDVRKEAGNKRSLMGVYSSHYIVQKTGIVVPKLCLAVMIVGIKDLIRQLKVTFYNPGFDPQVIKLDAPTIDNGGAATPDANLDIVVSPFKIKEAGEARFELDFGTEEAPEAVHKFTIKTMADLNQ